MDKICLVFDIDETILHYGPDDYLPQKFEYEENETEWLSAQGLKNL